MDQKVVSLSEFRIKKELHKNPDRTPLYMSHLSEGALQGSPHFERPSASDFGDRFARIRASLERVQRLMESLKRK